MKHEKTVDKMLRIICYESWMNEDDYQAFLVEFIKRSNVSKENMNNIIQIGIDHGVSAERQIELTEMSVKEGGLSE